MARTAAQDPIEKFRFEVLVLTSNMPILASFNKPEFDKLGFSEVVIPKISITEIQYRENVDVSSLRKQPGLVKYEDLVLRRGVTFNQDLYIWLNSTVSTILGVSSEATLLSSGFTELSVIPTQETFYRRDLIVSAKDRMGNYTKHWFFYNCFVNGYKPGNDFNAASDEKLIEELSISFEVMIESNADTITGAQLDINNQIQNQFAKAALTALL